MGAAASVQQSIGEGYNSAEHLSELHELLNKKHQELHIDDHGLDEGGQAMILFNSAMTWQVEHHGQQMGALSEEKAKDLVRRALSSSSGFPEVINVMASYINSLQAALPGVCVEVSKPRLSVVSPSPQLGSPRAAIASDHPPLPPLAFHDGPYAVSLGFLRDFYISHKDLISSTMTTAEVVDQLIRPATSATKESYIKTVLGPEQEFESFIDLKYFDK